MRSDSFVRSLRQTTVKPSQMKLVKGRDAFDSLESLCSYVESEAARNRKASPPSKISITRWCQDIAETTKAPRDNIHPNSFFFLLKIKPPNQKKMHYFWVLLTGPGLIPPPRVQSNTYGKYDISLMKNICFVLGKKSSSDVFYSPANCSIYMYLLEIYQAKLWLSLFSFFC